MANYAKTSHFTIFFMVLFFFVLALFSRSEEGFYCISDEGSKSMCSDRYKEQIILPEKVKETNFKANSESKLFIEIVCDGEVSFSSKTLKNFDISIKSSNKKVKLILADETNVIRGLSTESTSISLTTQNEKSTLEADFLNFDSTLTISENVSVSAKNITATHRVLSVLIPHFLAKNDTKITLKDNTILGVSLSDKTTKIASSDGSFVTLSGSLFSSLTVESSYQLIYLSSHEDFSKEFSFIGQNNSQVAGMFFVDKTVADISGTVSIDGYEMGVIITNAEEATIKESIKLSGDFSVKKEINEGFCFFENVSNQCDDDSYAFDVLYSSVVFFGEEKVVVHGSSENKRINFDAHQFGSRVNVDCDFMAFNFDEDRSFNEVEFTGNVLLKAETNIFINVSSLKQMKGEIEFPQNVTFNIDSFTLVDTLYNNYSALISSTSNLEIETNTSTVTFCAKQLKLGTIVVDERYLSISVKLTKSLVTMKYNGANFKSPVNFVFVPKNSTLNFDVSWLGQMLDNMTFNVKAVQGKVSGVIVPAAFKLRGFYGEANNGLYCMFISSESSCSENEEKIRYSPNVEVDELFQPNDNSSVLTIRIFDNTQEQYPKFKAGVFDSMKVKIISDEGYMLLDCKEKNPASIDAESIRIIATNYKQLKSIDSISLNDSRISFQSDSNEAVSLSVEKFELSDSLLFLPSNENNAISVKTLVADVTSISDIAEVLKVSDEAKINGFIVSVEYFDSHVTLKTKSSSSAAISFSEFSSILVNVKGSDETKFSLAGTKVKKSITYNIESSKEIEFDQSWNSLTESVETKIESEEALTIRLVEKVKEFFTFPPSANITIVDVVVNESSLCISNDPLQCGNIKCLSFIEAKNINPASKKLNIKVIGGNETVYPVLTQSYFLDKQEVTIKSDGLFDAQLPVFVAGSLEIDTSMLKISLANDSTIQKLTLSADRVVFSDTNKKLVFKSYVSLFDSDRTILRRSSGEELVLLSDSQRNITLGQTLKGINFESKTYSLKNEATLLCADEINDNLRVISHGDVKVNVDESCYEVNITSLTKKVRVDQQTGKMELVLPRNTVPDIFNVSNTVVIKYKEDKTDESNEGKLPTALVLFLVILAVCFVILVGVIVVLKFLAEKEASEDSDKSEKEEDSVNLNTIDTTLIPIV